MFISDGRVGGGAGKMVLSTETFFAGDGSRAGGRGEPGELVFSIAERVVMIVVVGILLVVVIVVVLKK